MASNREILGMAGLLCHLITCFSIVFLQSEKNKVEILLAINNYTKKL